MAMNGNTLGAAIASALGVTDVDAVANWKKVGVEIVDHIKTNAAVANTGTATGVTAGGAVAPVTSMGTIS